MTHRNFDDCLAEEDQAISWFDGDGSAYCHHCRRTETNARTVQRHGRTSTMEKPNAEPTTTIPQSGG